MSSNPQPIQHESTGITSGGGGGPVMPQSVDSGINIPLVFTIVAFSAILVAAAVIATQAWFYQQITLEQQSKSLGQQNQPLLDAKFQQLQNISTYRWVDPKTSQTAIPIDRAMELTVQAYQRGENLRVKP